MTATLEARIIDEAPAGIGLRLPRIEYPADGSVCPVARLVWRPVETTPVPERPSAALRGKVIAIANGTDASARRIADILETHGAVTARFPNDAADDETAARFTAATGRIDGIVDLNACGSAGKEGHAGRDARAPSSAEAWEAPLRRSVALLKACYAAWVEEADAARLFYMPVTLLGGRMGYGGIIQPLGGIWAGLAKTLPREVPNCNIRILDLSAEHFEEAGEIIARELYRWGLFEIGYCGGKRYTLWPQKEEVGPTVIRLGPGDTLLMSGGARGIGFALAEGLARSFGCRVVVTGRQTLPRGDEPWLHLDENAFKAYHRDLLKSLPAGKTVAQAKREAEQARRRKELYEHLRESEAAGLRIEYRPCDFNHAGDVRALVEEIGPRLRGVIHNAGVDAPIRLPGKSLDSFVDTVRVKVTGFFNLLEAVRDRDLAFFCGVGSMTGRCGGMIGETDYAAANEGLARLGMWAAETAPFPVHTLVWPTWDRLGNITNYETAVKYMSSMNVEEGVYRWQRELLAGTRGEVTFVGKIGRALSPLSLRAYPPSPELPNIDVLYSQVHYLGDTLQFNPARSIRSRMGIDLADAAAAQRPEGRSRAAIDARTAPCLSDFRLGGVPALPVSILLEYALALGEWIGPDPWSRLHLWEVRDMEVHLPALRLTAGGTDLESDAVGSWDDGAWVVALHVTGLGSEGTQELARMRLVYRGEPPESLQVPPETAGAPFSLTAPAAATWAGFVFPLARWSRQRDGGLRGAVRASAEADLWTTVLLPRLVLPASHLENILRASLALRGSATCPARLCLNSMAVYSGDSECRTISRAGDGEAWLAADGEGRVRVRVEGLGYRDD